MLQLILAALASFGFEQGTDLPEGFATHTYSGAAVCVWEESGRGGRSVSIASDSGADAAWQTRLAVRPGAVYRLSGWIRAEGVLSRGGRGALFNVHEIPGAATPALTGTRPWTFVECEFETGPRAEVTVNCLFGGWGEATGMAFFDDLDLELLFQPDPERPAAIIDLEREFGDLSPHIYGQFIEHLGRCINGGIWAEMLEDRKFFHQAGSFDSPWRRLAGEEGVSVAMDVERPCANDWSVKLTRAARAGTEPCGIEQRGLGVLAGREYRGRFLLAGQGSVEVALSWGEGGSEHQALAFDVDCAEFTAFSVALRAGGASEDAALSIDLQGEGGVWIGACSLMPADNVRGLRADVLDLLKQLDAPIYRWPGGNFVSGYDWRDGLGPPDQRPTRKNPAWQGIEPNDFGACEFLDFCAEVEAEPLVVVNTGLGSPELAAALVEFLNGPAESPQGRRRARLGRVEPYGVRWFGVGNEMYGDWQLGHVPLERYVVRHREFAAAMRAVDPSIKLVAVGASGEWSRRMLAECGGDMDLLSEHFYCGGADDLEEHVAQIPLAVREKAASHRHSLSTLAGRAIPIALDEWNYWYGEHVYGELGTRYFLRDALGIARGLHEMARHPDVFFMANYAQTVNVIGCVKTTKTAACLETTALPLLLYRRHFRGQALAVTGPGGPLDVAAARDGARLVIGVVNASREKKTLRLETKGGAGMFPRARRFTIAGADDMAYNEPGQPPRVCIREDALQDFAPGALEIEPVSVTLFLADLIVVSALPEGVFREKDPRDRATGAVFPTFTQLARYDAGMSEISLRRQECPDEQSHDWRWSENAYSTRLKIVAVDSRLGGGELFVAGIEPDTEASIIERWVFPVRSGRWHHTYTGTANPIGTPTAAYTYQNSIEGGLYRPPPALWYAPERTVVLRTMACGFVRSLACDPEGRYLLFSTYPWGYIYQLDLMDPGAPLARLFGISEIAELAGASWLEIRQHADLGRVCVVSPPDISAASAQPVPPKLVYLIDGNNDGVFEAHVAVEIEEDRMSRMTAVVDPVTFQVVPLPESKWSAPWAGGLCF